MMTRFQSFAIAALVLSLTACSSDDTPSADDVGKERPISLSVGIGELNVVTRASQAFTPSGGQLGLYITANGSKNTDKYVCTNAKFTYSSYSNNWSCPNTYYWASDNATIEYIAYYPYSDSGFDSDWDYPNSTYIYSLMWDRTSANPDLLWQSASATNATSTTLPITLQHACAKLTVNVKRFGSEIASGVNVTGMTLSNMSKKGKFYLSGSDAGTWEPGHQYEDITLQSATTSEGAVATFETILIPETIATTLSITLDNSTTYQLAIPSQEYKRGTNYTLTIQVGQDQVTAGEITQTPWVDGGSYDLTAQ
ncbi:MAG: fimbrillin family protein [Prevotella sp.]|nr:fimbrillin family protein [Prevotella sp.]